MPSEAVGELLKLGLPGIIIMALLYALKTVYREKEDLRVKAEAMLAAVNEKRIEEATRTVVALARSEGLMEKMNDNIERLTTAVSNVSAGRQRG